jgi:cellulose biosynthesis protein BcsQ
MSPVPPATTTTAATSPEPGEIITFYSYKGGTGRSMALANVACLLAQRAGGVGRGVLLVDWDLEAPGLHRYFQHLFPGGRGEDSSDGRPGLIEFFSELERHVPPEGYGTEDEAAEEALRLAEKFDARSYALPLDVPGLYLFKAGRFDDGYSELVNTFDWEGLYRRSPHLFRALAARWAEEFDYVLIDSRTGVTDTSGICTILMPEKLVVVFTPNRQSFTGVANLVRKATRHRKESDDLRPLMVFPLPSRIEPSLQELRNLWRFGDPTREVVGYQPLFESLFREVYGTPPDDPAADGQSAPPAAPPEKFDLGEYFEEVQIQQTPDYAYGEEIAVLVEKQRDRFSLTRSYQTFTERLVRTEGPWERPPEEKGVASEEAADAKKASLLAVADRMYATLAADKRASALRLLARLVNVAPPGEGSRDTASYPIKYEALEWDARRAVDDLTSCGLVQTNAGADAKSQSEAGFVIADETLVNDWPPLRDWIEKNRDFLFWRQKLRTYLDDWERGGRTRGDLLSGSTLAAATLYLQVRSQDLSDLEASYIKESVQTRKASANVRAILVVLTVLSLLAGIVTLYLWLSGRLINIGSNTNINANTSTNTSTTGNISTNTTNTSTSGNGNTGSNTNAHNTK